MREIKFRAWDKKVGKYYYNVCFHHREEVVFISLPPFYQKILSDHGYWNGWRCHIDSCVLEQYIGLKDKNDKEIYEGDIYKNSWNTYSMVRFKMTDGRETTGHGRTERLIESGFYLSSVPKEIEVVGNIHENIELLNGGGR